MLKYPQLAPIIPSDLTLEKKKWKENYNSVGVFCSSPLRSQLALQPQTGTSFRWLRPQPSTCQRCLQHVLGTACAIMLKDTPLTATGHCDPGTGWHMNEWCSTCLWSHSSLTNTWGHITRLVMMHAQWHKGRLINEVWTKDSLTTMTLYFYCDIIIKLL